MPSTIHTSPPENRWKDCLAHLRRAVSGAYLGYSGLFCEWILRDPVNNSELGRYSKSTIEGLKKKGYLVKDERGFLLLKETKR